MIWTSYLLLSCTVVDGRLFGLEAWQCSDAPGATCAPKSVLTQDVFPGEGAALALLQTASSATEHPRSHDKTRAAEAKKVSKSLLLKGKAQLQDKAAQQRKRHAKDKEQTMLAYMRVATGKWCDNQFDAVKAKDGPAERGYTLDACEAACTGTASCTMFAFDGVTGWCTTYSRCGTPTTNPNNRIQKRERWVLYEKVYVPQTAQRGAISNSANTSKSKAPEDARLQEVLVQASDAENVVEAAGDQEAIEKIDLHEVFAAKYLRVAKGMWCDVIGGAKKNKFGTAARGHTLESCKLACAGASSCGAFSFDSRIGWCTTFATCGKPTSNPHGQTEETEGWATYVKYSDAQALAAAQAKQNSGLSSE